MKTFIVVICLSIVLAIGGVFATKELHEMTVAAGGSNAIIRGTTTGATSQQQIQQNLEHSVEGTVQQVRSVPDDK